MFDVFLAGGASNTQWNSAKPSSASHPERDRTQKGQDPRLWGLWDCLQGKSHKKSHNSLHVFLLLIGGRKYEKNPQVEIIMWYNEKRRRQERWIAGSLMTGNEMEGWRRVMKRISNSRYWDPRGYSEIRSIWGHNQCDDGMWRGRERHSWNEKEQTILLKSSLVILYIHSHYNTFLGQR